MAFALLTMRPNNLFTLNNLLYGDINALCILLSPYESYSP